MTLSRKDLDEMMRDIERSNLVLWQFTEGSVLLEDTRRNKWHRDEMPEFEMIRRHATGLSTALKNSRCQIDRCWRYHIASLRLEIRRPTTAQKLERITTGLTSIRFGLLFSGANLTSDLPTPEYSREIEVLSIPRYEAQYPEFDASIKRVVRFKPPTTSHRNLPLHDVAENKEEARLLTNLCSAVFSNESDTAKERLGYLEGEDSRTSQHARHMIYLIKKTKTVKATTLDQLLQDNSHRLFGCTLPWGERLSIAVTLASSILQLDGTLWLRTSWTSKDILVHYQESFGKHGSLLQNVCPHVSWEINSQDANRSEGFRLSEQLTCSIQCDEILIALGMALVELCFGRTLLSMCNEENEGRTEDDIRLMTALDLLHDVQLQAEHNYATVVDRCLNGDWKRIDDRFGDENFELAVFEHIVKPLIDDLEHFRGEDDGHTGRRTLERQVNYIRRSNM